MTLLPYEQLIYKSPLSAQELHQKLKEAVEVGPAGSKLSVVKKKTDKPYRGEVSAIRFDIVRQINYRNSFLPRITGQIHPQGSGCTIKVKMQLHPFVLIFMLFWFGILFSIGGTIMANGFDTPGGSWQGAIPVLMLLFGYALVMGGFKTESRKAKKELATIFNAKKDPFGRKGFY